ncbi:N-acyl-D-amino-acid deacylase family protein [Sphingosinicella rhizophila]|uniref:Amidohydrolase family protein n=1 Tax=Sphingosinicella rhizophila TaxID=3050082 RepID=A0ABU3QB05_9SPHN|nr:amidohydrolase family protein [Sphingosinicella sp. GR2756]MDT9600507.1 amidohydrolase family protein [Sphingosinicella sp. GR2756]
MKRFFLLAAAVMLIGAAPASHDYDIVIRNGRVLDGAGNPWIDADVAVRDGRIVRIGAIDGRGAREIDASGRYVSPGFIDMMDQSGRILLENGAAENKLRMGVTTVIAGEGGTPVDAAEIPAYFDRLEKRGIAVNFATYYSATQARVKVMGNEEGHPTAAQMAEMEGEVATAMRNGAFGISTALLYATSNFQTTADLITLARIAARCDGFYASHIRDESEKLVEAVNEAIEIGEKGGVKVEIFHLKGAHAGGWGKLIPAAVASIEAARGRGVDVAADLYPYAAAGTGLEITVPTWVWADGKEKGIERLRDPKVRARLKKELVTGSPGWSNVVAASGGWQNVVLANAQGSRYSRFEGRNLAEIGKELGRDPVDLAWDIVIEAQPKRAMALYFVMSEDDIVHAIRQPWVSIGSDASSVMKLGEVDALGLAHPRAYGTFPRVIAEYVKRRQVLGLPDAVRKMSGWPAQRMGLSDRGLLREGMRADIIIFDLEELDDVADWQNPTGVPTGIETVIVNGQVTLDAHGHTGARAGRVLRHPCPGS